MFDELLRGWDGDEVVIRFDAASGSWMLIGVHSTLRGPAMGGTRMKVYAAPEDALADVLRALASDDVQTGRGGPPVRRRQGGAGGPGRAGAGVTRAPRPAPRVRGARGRLHGTYVTAADMNTGPHDMDVVGDRTPHVLGRCATVADRAIPGGGTAIGVFHGIRADVPASVRLARPRRALDPRAGRRLRRRAGCSICSDADDARSARVRRRRRRGRRRPRRASTRSSSIRPT